MTLAIGGRVKHERNARGWTLDRLAEAASISRRMVVSVEQGAANPSVGTLLRLSDALGVGLPALVEPPDRAPVVVTRRGEGAALWAGEFGGRGILVAGTNPPNVIELWDWTLGLGDTHVSEAHAAGTQELVHVLEGSLGVDVAGRSIVLEAGDAAGFPGDGPHAYVNLGDRSTRFCLAVFEPGVGVGDVRQRAPRD